MSIEKLIESFVNPEVRDDEQQKAFDSIKEIFSNQQLTIQDLIKLLESALISDQEKKRYRGTLLLSDLLLQVSSFPLNSAVIHLLVVFFNQRLSDYPSIIPALRALLAIVKFHSANFDAKYLDFVDIVQTIFKVFDVQSYAQSIRQCIYELLLDAFMQSQCREQCMTIATDVFAGVMVSFDGEKDPRCLLVALDLLLSAVHSFHTTMTADVFEKVSDTLAAYFPISFQPPPDDPYGITAEDLNKKLFDCFLCHPSLLPYCLPYFATQLLSDTSTTKVFAMEAIGQLCRTYGVSILTSTFGNISESQQPAIYRVTEAILDVLFESGSADAVTRGLDFVYEIASLIGTSPHAKYADEWKLFCAPLLQKSVRIIAESADSLKGEAACMIACCISASSVLCSGIVFQECLPPLLTVLEKAHHSPIASATSDMVSSSCDNPDHHHDHSHNHDYNNDRTGQLLAKTQMKHLRLLNQLLASCGFNSLLTIQQADKDICELYQGFNVVFVRTAKLLKSTDRHTCLLPAVVANSFGALGPLNPLGPFAAELLSMLKQLLESSSCIEITESKAIRDHCYESLSILIVRLGELSIDEALLSQLRVCIILATKDALGNQDRRIETAKQPSAVKFLVTVVLTPSLTELMSDCCFGKVSSLPQSHHTLALVATLGRQLNLFGQGDGSRKLFSTCFDRLAFHFINFADIGMFMSDVEAISAILISEGEFEAWSEPTQRSIRVYPQTNADFSFSLCTPGGLVQVAIEHLFALGRNDEESNSDSYALLKRVCSLIHRVFLALVDDAPKQSDTGVRLLEVIQLQYDTCLGGRKTFFATSLVLSVLIYLNRSAEFFAKSHHSSITSNMDLELVSGSFTSVFTAIPFFIVTWMSSIDCAPVATEVLSVLLNKVCIDIYVLYP